VEREIERGKKSLPKVRRNADLWSLRKSRVIYMHREKQEQDLNKLTNNKEVDGLEQVAGTAEGDVAGRIAKFCDHQTLHSDKSLPASPGPTIVHTCGTPKKYKVCIF